MTTNPYVRRIGAVDDIDGAPLTVSVVADTVEIGNLIYGHRFDAASLRRLLGLIWEASRHAAINGERWQTEQKDNQP